MILNHANVYSKENNKMIEQIVARLNDISWQLQGLGRDMVKTGESGNGLAFEKLAYHGKTLKDAGIIAGEWADSIEKAQKDNEFKQREQDG